MYNGRKSEDYKMVARKCREAGFSEGRVYVLCMLLCESYREKYLNALADDEIKEMTPEAIEASKRECRDLFLYLFTKPAEENIDEQKELIDKLIKLIWFRGKIDYILDKVLDFKGNGNGYVYKMLVKLSYFDEEYRTNKDIYTKLDVCKTDFYPKRDIGVILFGISMWIYALRRQKEDMEAGIIPYKELPKPQENLKDLPPIDEL
ncbi:hypothetical protein [Butyrivibrio sp. AE3004]|uniref:hypothetical protein n=1 Tax=Butyrivibrio sp. AE3004 TaxID=1506994 RepID=UPI000493E523|nr:hypothetical protein [Butyrivibrio sp. AE3004]